ncbi:unnamed protein product, partial [Brachionus calyciflorus]
MSFDETSQILDVPRGGPLELARAKSSFNWKKMKLFFEDLDLINYKNQIWDTLRKDADFIRPTEEPSLMEQKKICQKRCLKIKKYNFINEDIQMERPLKRILFDEAIVLWDIDTSVKYSLHFQMFEQLLKTLGTLRHQQFVEGCEKGDIFGCFAMTEMSHGSNTKNLKTTAHYDPKTEEFVINTPSIEDCKIWVGNLGKFATHSAVYAQLYTPDNQCHGLHIFIVPVRDPYTMALKPGVICGEMGPKAGLNGVDNGFATFNQVRIPRENLLNKTGDVTPDGVYVSPIKDAKKRFGISLGALSNGRVGLTYYAHSVQGMALTIALRYAAARKQFGEPETPILEYQSHEYRLMPLLAIRYTWHAFSMSFFDNLSEFLIGLFTGDKSDRQAELGREIHAISCVSKPASSWNTQRVIQECREACGGHGYLKASRLGDLRNSNDPLLTFEGDNNVLIQQTRQLAETPLKTVEFLRNFDQKLQVKFKSNSKEDLLNQKSLMEMFDWLICYMVKISHDKLQNNLKKGQDLFTARNENQVFYSKSLALIFMERQLIERFIEKINQNKDESLGKVLNRILYLAGLYLLDNHVGLFYQGGFYSTEKPVFLIRECILELCRELRDDAMGLVDAMAPPDFVLNSVLGESNGE